MIQQQWHRGDLEQQRNQQHIFYVIKNIVVKPIIPEKNMIQNP